MGRVDCWKDGANLDFYGFELEEAKKVLLDVLSEVVSDEVWANTKISYSPPERSFQSVAINGCSIPYYLKDGYIRFQVLDWNHAEILFQKSYKKLQLTYGDRVKHEDFQWYDY